MKGNVKKRNEKSKANMKFNKNHQLFLTTILMLVYGMNIFPLKLEFSSTNVFMAVIFLGCGCSLYRIFYKNKKKIILAITGSVFGAFILSYWLKSQYMFQTGKLNIKGILLTFVSIIILTTIGCVLGTYRFKNLEE